MINPSIVDFLDLFRCPASHTPLTVTDNGDLCSSTGVCYTGSEKGVPCLIAGKIPSETLAQQSHYEKIAGAYQENLAFPHTQAYQAYLDGALDKTVARINLGTVAEICCGHGESFHLYSGRIARGIGVDISLSMLHTAIAKEYGKHIYFVQGDATELPLADDSFDAVFLLGGIHHVPDKKRLYDECRRILKPGGMLIAREPSDDFFLWRWLRKIIYTLSPVLDAETERPLRKHEEFALLEGGYALAGWNTYGFLGYCIFMNSDVLKVNAVFRHIPGIRAIVRLAAAFDSLCLKVPGLRNAGAQVIFTAQKTGNAIR